MKKLFILLFWLGLSGAAQAVVQVKEVTYKGEQHGYGSPIYTMLKGYLAYDDAISGKRPGILVVPEWWGNNEYAHRRARMLAELGYTALAIDMYGDGKVTDQAEEAAKLAAEVNSNRDLEETRFFAAYDLLSKQETVNPNQIAAFGYCFGGTVALNMVRAGANLEGVASFHGGLSSSIPIKPNRYHGHIVSFSGDADPLIGPDKIAAFKQEMEKAGIDYRIVTYPGAKHAFSNPDADALGKKFNLPIAYNAAADKDSWEQATKFLREIFPANK